MTVSKEGINVNMFRVQDDRDTPKWLYSSLIKESKTYLFYIPRQTVNEYMEICQEKEDT